MWHSPLTSLDVMCHSRHSFLTSLDVITPLSVSRTIQYLHRCLKTKDPLCQLGNEWRQTFQTFHTFNWEKKTVLILAFLLYFNCIIISYTLHPSLLCINTKWWTELFCKPCTNLICINTKQRVNSHLIQLKWYYTIYMMNDNNT